MSEIAFETNAKEAQAYLGAVEKCRKATREVTQALESLVTLLAKAANTYDSLVRYPGSSGEMINYYLDSSRRLNTFLLEDMTSFRAVWVNNVVYQLDDLVYNARCATTAAKRRREARGRYLKSSQKSSIPFASAVSPEKQKQRKDDYAVRSEEFEQTYKAFNGLRVQTVGVLQAHYFHDHSVLLRRLSEALKLRSTPPPPLLPLHASDGTLQAGATPSHGLQLRERGSSDDEGGAGGRESYTDGDLSGTRSSRSSHHRHRGARIVPQSSRATDEAAFQEVSEDAEGGSSRNNSSTRSIASTSRSGSTQSTPSPPTNSETRLPLDRFEAPQKPSSGAQQRRLSQTGAAFRGTDGSAGFPEAEAALPTGHVEGTVSPVEGIPVVFEPSSFQQYRYHARSLARGAGAEGRAAAPAAQDPPSGPRDASSTPARQQPSQNCHQQARQQQRRQEANASSSQAPLGNALRRVANATGRTFMAAATATVGNGINGSSTRNSRNAGPVRGSGNAGEGAGPAASAGRQNAHATAPAGEFTSLSSHDVHRGGEDFFSMSPSAPDSLNNRRLPSCGRATSRAPPSVEPRPTAAQDSLMHSFYPSFFEEPTAPTSAHRDRGSSTTNGRGGATQRDSVGSTMADDYDIDMLR